MRGLTGVAKGTAQWAFYTACGETPGGCHPEESRAAGTTKDLCSSLKLQLRRFFASLRMTVWRGFSAACIASLRSLYLWLIL